jgi:HEAT repeat protein
MAAVLAAGLCGWAAAQEGPVVQGRPVSEWLKQLKGENRGLQVRAARALSEAPEDARGRIAPLVIPVLQSERENDRFVAAQVLGDYGPAARAAIPHLLPMLLGTQFERNRAAAAKALGQILKDAQPDEEVAKVVDALTCKIDSDYDRYSDVRREAVRALGMIGPAAKSCIPKLVRVMNEGSHGLGSTQDQEYRLVRRETAWTCGRMGPLAAGHMDRLIARMHTEGEWCPEVVVAIGAIGPIQDNVIPNIMDKIESSGRPGDAVAFKVPAFAVLGAFGAKSAAAVPLIRRMLRDTVGDNPIPIKTAMVKALAAIGPAAKEAAPEIEAQVRIGESRAGDAEYATLRDEAAKAYKALTGQDAPPAGAPKQ